MGDDQIANIMHFTKLSLEKEITSLIVLLNAFFKNMRTYQREKMSLKINLLKKKSISGWLPARLNFIFHFKLSNNMIRQNETTLDTSWKTWDKDWERLQRLHDF